MPSVPEALQRLDREISGARQQQQFLLKVIHGYGSTGVGGAVSAYVYSTSQGSVASASPLTGISSGDVLLLVGILATLGLVAVLTLRLSRLQS